MADVPDGNEKALQVRRMFDSIAGRYDLMNTLMTFGFDSSWRRLVVKKAGISPGGRALDICCGTGMLTRELARVAGKQGEVIGLDFSEMMLAGARKNLAGEIAAGQVRLKQGDAMNLPFNDNSFDCVTVGWGLRNVADIATVLQEMRRVVKPGGRVVSLDMAKPQLPVFKQAYWLYFRHLIPLMGKIWAGKKDAYRYLHDSALMFPEQGRLAEMFAEAGLTDAGYINLCGGVVAIVEGCK